MRVREMKPLKLGGNGYILEMMGKLLPKCPKFFTFGYQLMFLFMNFTEFSGFFLTQKTAGQVKITFIHINVLINFESINIEFGTGAFQWPLFHTMASLPNHFDITCTYLLSFSLLRLLSLLLSLSLLINETEVNSLGVFCTQ